MIVLGNEFNSFVTKKANKMNFRFDRNNTDLIYLISCTICGRQYTGTNDNDVNNDKTVQLTCRTYSPNHQFSFNKFKNCIKNTTNRELQKAFNDKKYSLLHDNQRN